MIINLFINFYSNFSLFKINIYLDFFFLLKLLQISHLQLKLYAVYSIFKMRQSK